ncbi:MAG: hypothetical protein SVG88_11625 [Halobacteriales archaeon]|nr:hypothetical protein [Halobacteriales archaeon]
MASEFDALDRIAAALIDSRFHAIEQWDTEAGKLRAHAEPPGVAVCLWKDGDWERRRQYDRELLDAATTDADIVAARMDRQIGRSGSVVAPPETDVSERSDG